MADDRVQQTGDLLRPVRSRPRGVRAVAWYGVIAVLATVAVVYLVGIFAAPGHQDPAPSSLIGQADARAAGTGDDAFRYSGPVVDQPRSGNQITLKRAVPARRDRAALSSAPARGMQARTVPQLVAPATNVALPSDDVPDVSDASASRVRVALPTPAPDDAVGQRQIPAAPPAVGEPPAGMMVVYGAPRAAPGTTASSASDVPTRAPLAEASTVRQREAAAETRTGAVELEGSGRGTLRSETMPATRRAPLAKFLVPAGTPIAVQLDVALESDVAGPVVAHVVRDVVDPLSGEVLIPGGTKVMGDYTGLVAGQSRLSVAWRRLLFPDMSSFALDGAPALDEDGRVGVAGRLDRHDGGLVRRTLFSGLLAELARRIGLSEQPSANTMVVISTGGTTQPGLPEAILAAADRLNQRDANEAPKVTISANAIVSLYVARDMLFEGPYRALPAQGAVQ
jgi:type IV secretory pathway VirB10-like protein